MIIKKNLRNIFKTLSFFLKMIYEVNKIKNQCRKFLWKCLSRAEEIIFEMLQKSLLTLWCQWYCRAWLCGVNDIAEPDSMVSIIKQSLTPWCQWYCRAWLHGINDTAKPDSAMSMAQRDIVFSVLSLQRVKLLSMNLCSKSLVKGRGAFSFPGQCQTGLGIRSSWANRAGHSEEMSEWAIYSKNFGKKI